jgi:hypothetical protein
MSLTCEAVDSSTKTTRPRRAANYTKATGLCRWCQAPLNNLRSTAKYCSPQHLADHHNYLKTQGFALINVAKRWRKEQRSGKGALRKARNGISDFSLLTRIIDDLVAQDEALGVNHYPDPPAEFFARKIKAVKR